MLAEILLTSSIMAHRLIQMSSAYHFISMFWYGIRSFTVEPKEFRINDDIVKDYNDIFFVLAVLLQCVSVEINDISFLPFFISMICGYTLDIWVIVIVMTLFCMYLQWETLLFLFSIYFMTHASGTRPKVSFLSCAAVHLIISITSPLELNWFEIGVGILHSEAMIQSYGSSDLQFLSQIGALGCSIGPMIKSIWCYFPALLSFTYFWNIKWKMFRFIPIGYTGIWFIFMSITAIYVRPMIAGNYTVIIED